MKITLWTLLSITILSQTLKAQVVPLFSTVYDSTCLPYTPITNNGYVINDALSYVWNFGNGTTSTQKYPNYNYIQAGNFNLSLTITTNATDKMVNGLTISAIPGSWDDNVNDKKPDLYFVVKDSLGTIILRSNVIWDMFPPVIFNTNFLLKTGKPYSLELWEYDETGRDDFLAYMPITSGLTNTYSNNGGTIVLTALPNATTYSQTKNLKLYNAPTVNITSSNGLLTANINGGVGGSYSYSWSLNNTYLSDGYQKTYKPVQNGAYTVSVSSSNCSATSPIFNATRVDVEDLKGLQNVHIYPTPSVLNEKKWISIQSLETKTIDLVISDVSGKSISRQMLNLKIGENTFELPSINLTGFYFIRLLKENQTVYFGKTTIF